MKDLMFNLIKELYEDSAFSFVACDKHTDEEIKERINLISYHLLKLLGVKIKESDWVRVDAETINELFSYTKQDAMEQGTKIYCLFIKELKLSQDQFAMLVAYRLGAGCKWFDDIIANCESSVTGEYHYHDNKETWMAHEIEA